MADQTSMLNALSSWWNDVQTFTHAADNEAEKRFPGQARDSSIKNAYRHAIKRQVPRIFAAGIASLSNKR